MADQPSAIRITRPLRQRPWNRPAKSPSSAGLRAKCKFKHVKVRSSQHKPSPLKSAHSRSMLRNADKTLRSLQCERRVKAAHELGADCVRGVPGPRPAPAKPTGRTNRRSPAVHGLSAPAPQSPFSPCTTTGRRSTTPRPYRCHGAVRLQPVVGRVDQSDAIPSEAPKSSDASPRPATRPVRPVRLPCGANQPGRVPGGRPEKPLGVDSRGCWTVRQIGDLDRWVRAAGSIKKNGVQPGSTSAKALVVGFDSNTTHFPSGDHQGARPELPDRTARSRALLQ